MVDTNLDEKPFLKSQLKEILSITLRQGYKLIFWWEISSTFIIKVENNDWLIKIRGINNFNI